MLLCLALPALGQPAFTVASVKPIEPGKQTVTIDGGRVSFTAVTLKTLIGRAYSVKDYQVTGPDWISNATYKVEATMPPDTPVTVVWRTKNRCTVRSPTDLTARQESG